MGPQVWEAFTRGHCLSHSHHASFMGTDMQPKSPYHSLPTSLALWFFRTLSTTWQNILDLFVCVSYYVLFTIMSPAPRIVSGTQSCSASVC